MVLQSPNHKACFLLPIAPSAMYFPAQFAKAAEAGVEPHISKTLDLFDCIALTYIAWKEYV